MSNPFHLPKSTLSDEGVYHVYSLCYARLPRRVRENFIGHEMHDGPMPLDYNLWILRNEHRTVLVDTGFGQRAATERGRVLDVDPIEALVRLGIDPDSIEDIVITHLHYDHAGNIGRFAKARFHVQDAEVAYATGRCMCERPLRFAFDLEDVVTLVRHTYADRVRFHDGVGAPLPGISVHVMPGHTVGMQAVRVMTPRGPIVLASDVSHYYANYLRRSPFVATVDVIASMRSYDKLKELAGAPERIVPGHDPKVRALYPKYNFGGIELTALHEEPKPHDLEELVRLDNF
ncbi:N-acyl homoserine lactonase (plasmid) [Variovorax sp. SRS16]|uniref:N-acyl homoserine lactonase family protein n=1 Tax=Variovorax sp. SRS16 TaxID=282217 RepID=UPI001317CAAE|nr:N-acyl homoserine lactonase family protein [Variovorax sp. SRS16]VTU45362.1 N-acyl homoserine lactonase [Variovorax sp. SRS16]